MARLYRLFKDAPVLGSLINPRLSADNMFVADYHELQPLLEKALVQETKDDTAHEMAVTARGLSSAAEILAGQFTLVATNVPYLISRKQDSVLQDFCATYFPASKGDLATTFVDRGLSLLSVSGTQAIVSPQNWLFLGSYKEFRSDLLRSKSFNLIARLGAKGFQTQMWDFNVALFLISSNKPNSSQPLVGLTVESIGSPEAKASELPNAPISSVPQLGQLKNPGAVMTFSVPSSLSPLNQYASAPNGSHGSDSPRHRRPFWEFDCVTNNWRAFQGTFPNTTSFAGREFLFSWFGDGMEHRDNPAARLQGEDIVGKRGVVVSMMGSLPVGLYLGDLFDISCTPIVPHDPNHLPAVWAYCTSPEYFSEVRKIDQALKVTNATLAKVPFNLAHWQKVAAEKYPHGLPKPFSSDPTQWLFNGHPKDSDQPLHVAVARLLGYQWPRQTGSSFPDCPALGPDALETLADVDGIVCLSATKGEAPAAERLRELLVQGLGNFDLATLLAGAGPKGSKFGTLEEWLRDEFFEQHCALFHHRPFIWHIWDGHKKGFSALVNYHKLTHANLEKLTYAYLGDWIRRQQAAVDAGEAGSDARLQAAKQLQARLKLILEGEPPYDIFVRWKPLSQQAIGWHPDINDGLRMNIRPFMAQDIPGGKKGAGILRTKPNIKWDEGSRQGTCARQNRIPLVLGLG